MKPCLDCGTTDYVVKRYVHLCRRCKSVRNRKWREDNPERVRHHNRIKRSYRESQRAWHKKNKARVSVMTRASSAANRALRRGKIKRQPCTVCGEEAQHMHHFDYAKPLEVIWLCVLHHRQVHAGIVDAS